MPERDSRPTGDFSSVTASVEKEDGSKSNRDKGRPGLSVDNNGTCILELGASASRSSIDLGGGKARGS